MSDNNDLYSVDLVEYAHKLNIVDVFRPGNPTGLITDPQVYTAKQNPDGSWQVPPWKGGKHIIKHTTAIDAGAFDHGGTSLRFLATQTVQAGLWTCAHYLMPIDDYTVYKLVPDGHACNHVGPGEWPLNKPDGGDTWLNSDSYGIEVEQPADWGHNNHKPTTGQYIKTALVCAFLAQRDNIPNYNIRDHGLVGTPSGRRTDPWCSMWDDCMFFWLLGEIRRPSNFTEILKFWFPNG